MRKLFTLTFMIFTITLLASCTPQSVVCGEGTVIQDGKCVAPDNGDNTNPTDGNNNNNGGTVANCDSLTGEVFYEVNFNDLSNSLVSNETGDLHTASNFVVWGQASDGPLINHSSIEDGSLVVSGLQGTQLDQYYESGLGYQFLEYENDVTYTVCAVVEGPTGQSMYSEIGIYYGFGTKDEVFLTGEPQVVIQDFRPTMTTNTDRGQYVLFAGNVTGEIKVHSIKIVENSQ